MKPPKTFYKYRAFDTRTLMSLCEDTLYFSNPGDFNDPLDCSPTLHCDSSITELKKLLSFFLTKRFSDEILEHLNKAKVKISNAVEHANLIAARQVEQELSYIAYLATDLLYDGQPQEDNEVHMLTDAVNRELREWYERGVCCFSTSFASPLLWSHYGQQHQGICIGYTTQRNPTPIPEKVVYGGNRAINTSLLCKAFLDGDIEASKNIDRDVLLRKAKGWKYESEWRLIDKQGLQSSPMLMTEVTFGLRCEIPIMHAVIRALEGRSSKVNFYYMYTVQNTFRLRRKKVNIDDIEMNYPVDAASGIEMFGPVA